MQLRWNRQTPSKADVKSLPGWAVMHSHSQGRDVPEHGFTVNCYSKAGFMKSWKDPEKFWEWPMREMRGLVINHDGDIIARGMPKFFGVDDGHLGDWKPEYDQYKLTLFEKFDGAMIVAWYHPDHGLRFTSKGGSDHEFEDWARREWEAGRVHGINEKWLSVLQRRDGPSIGVSLIFELIVPEDDHVVPVGTGNAKPGLHYLGFYDLEDDEYCPNVNKYSGHVMTIDSLDDMPTDMDDFEGWAVAVHDDDGNIIEMLKFKCDWYMQRREAKKLRESLTKDRKLWQQFRVRTYAAKTLDTTKPTDVEYNNEYALAVLDSFYDDWYTNNHRIIEKLERQLTRQMRDCYRFVRDHEGEARKDIAVAAQASNLPMPMIMAVLDDSVAKVEKFINSKSTWQAVLNERDEVRKQTEAQQRYEDYQQNPDSALTGDELRKQIHENREIE